MSTVTNLLARLAAPWTDPVSRTWWPSLLCAALVAAIVHLWRGRGARTLLSEGLGARDWRHPSALVDVQLLFVRILLRTIGVMPQLGGTFALATGLVMTLDRWVGRPEGVALPLLAITALYSVTLFVVSDVSRYLLHRALHEVPALWSLHQVHHSAEVLTPITFHRTHPLETLLYEARGVIATGVTAGAFFWVFRDRAVVWSMFGVNAIGILFNLITGNLRHSHVWLRYPAAVERWLLSPAQHQLHHSADPAHHGNYGVWLSLWDRMGGSLVLAGLTPPTRFGVDGANHRADDLVDALFGPLRDLLPRRGARLAPLLLVLATGRALAQDDDADEDTDAVEVIEITGEERVPRVAGSAHEITEEELERYEYNDIHRVLARVPGLYVRGEDGFGLRPNIGMRGANSDRSAKVTLTEDGILLAPAPYAAPAAYYFPLTTRMTGVEVFKGPSAIRFGPTTIGGAIDLHTRDIPDQHAAALDVSYGMRNSVKGHAWGAARFDRWGILLEGVHLSTDGFKQLDGQTRDDKHRADTGFDRQDVMLKLAAWSADGVRVRNRLDVKLGYGHERSDETYLGLSLSDFDENPYRRYAASAGNQMRWNRSQAELAWTLDIPGRFSIRTVAYHHGLTRAWTKLNRFQGGPDIHDLLLAQDAGQAGVFLDVLRGEADSATPDQNLMIGTNDRRFQSWGVQSTARWWAYGGIVTSQTEIGVRLHGDNVRRVHTEDPFAMTAGVLLPVADAETLTTLDSTTSALAFSAYVREDLAIGPVRLLPGVRTEVIHTSSLTAGADTLEGGASGSGAPIPDVATRTVVLPGFGIFGSATRWLDLFAGVHRGFAPVAPGQPDDVLPESSWAYEAGGRATARHTRGEVVGFLSDYRNISGSCTFSAGCDETQLDRQFNGGKAWVYGVESSVGQTFPLPRDVSLDAELVYTFTGMQFRTDFVSTFPQFGRVLTGDALPYVPTHQGALRLVVEHPWGSVAIAGNARSAMRDVAGQGEIPLTEKIPWSYTLDLAADVRVTKFLRAYVNVNNLTNRVNLESFRPFGARPSAPIQANFGVKLNTP